MQICKNSISRIFHKTRFPHLRMINTWIFTFSSNRHKLVENFNSTQALVKGQSNKKVYEIMIWDVIFLNRLFKSYYFSKRGALDVKTCFSDLADLTINRWTVRLLGYQNQIVILLNFNLMLL
jgi:hypothetical protein